jgi:hypothetical protein
MPVARFSPMFGVKVIKRLMNYDSWMVNICFPVSKGQNLSASVELDLFDSQSLSISFVQEAGFSLFGSRMLLSTFCLAPTLIGAMNLRVFLVMAISEHEGETLAIITVFECVLLNSSKLYFNRRVSFEFL